jgi:KDO2-lipid IV(A) lauroyltransferase
VNLAELGYTAAWRLLRHVPAPLAEAGFRAGADVAWRRGGAGVERLRRNLRRVRPAASEPELDRLVRAALRSYARYWQEAFRLPALDPATIHARHEAAGVDGLAEAIQQGRGVVLALPHVGNWDAAGVYVLEELRRRGHPVGMSTVAERLRPESVYRRFVEYREALGFEIVAQDEGRRAHLALTRRLRAGGLVCLIADRDLAGTGIDVPFFGDTVRLPSGPATLCALTGAQLHATVTYFRPGGWGATVSAPIQVPDRAAAPKATLELARAFEEHIAAHLEDWHMLQELTPGSGR